MTMQVSSCRSAGYFGKRVVDDDALEMLGTLPEDRAMAPSACRVRSPELGLACVWVCALFLAGVLKGRQKNTHQFFGW